MKVYCIFAIITSLVICLPLPGNQIRVTYVDGISSWWGAEAVAAAIGMPGYATDHMYTVINLAFLLSYGPADALSVWHHPFGFMEATRNPWGTTESEVLDKWR
jgi:hypothetical protein